MKAEFKTKMDIKMDKNHVMITMQYMYYVTISTESFTAETISSYNIIAFEVSIPTNGNKTTI